MYMILYLSAVKAILYVALGGALGALLRYLAGIWLKPDYHAAFPVHTFLINTIGCLMIGIVFAYIVANGSNAGLQLFVITGVLGGFTTFSSYTMETVYLMQQGEMARGLLYVGLSNVVGMGSAWLGYSMVKWIV
jgi:CrcB protein